MENDYKKEFMEKYKKVTNREIDIESLETEEIEKMNKMLDEELKIRKKRLEKKLEKCAEIIKEIEEEKKENN